MSLSKPWFEQTDQESLDSDIYNNSRATSLWYEIAGSRLENFFLTLIHLKYSYLSLAYHSLFRPLVQRRTDATDKIQK